MLIGLPSNGLHTNGYSLARKIVVRELKLKVDSHLPDLGETVGEALLRTHRSYLPRDQTAACAAGDQGHGAHYRRRHHRQPAADASPGIAARVDRASWRVPAIFRWLGESGRVPDTTCVGP